MGNYLYVNNIFTQLFGYTLEDIPTEEDWFSMAFPDISERKEVMLIWKNDPAHSITDEVETRRVSSYVQRRSCSPNQILPGHTPERGAVRSV